jgi:hypothetical protein
MRLGIRPDLDVAEARPAGAHERSHGCGGGVGAAESTGAVARGARRPAEQQRRVQTLTTAANERTGPTVVRHGWAGAGNRCGGGKGAKRRAPGGCPVDSGCQSVSEGQ